MMSIQEANQKMNSLIAKYSNESQLHLVACFEFHWTKDTRYRYRLAQLIYNFDEGVFYNPNVSLSFHTKESREFWGCSYSWEKPIYKGNCASALIHTTPRK